MPVIKVKELPIYRRLLAEVWQARFGVSLEADKSLIENRKILRQEIARNYGLYAGEFDSKRFEDVFNGIRNTEIHPENMLETAVPISNYPGIELLEAYCHLYYQLEEPSNPAAFRDSARAGTNWQRFVREYYQRQPAALPEHLGTPVELKLLGLNLCSRRAVVGAAGIGLALTWLVGWLGYYFIQWGYVPALPLPEAAVDTAQKGYFLSLSIASLIQSLIILALLVVYHYDEDLGGAHYIRRFPAGLVKTTLQQFQGGWLAIWISLLFLYLWFAFKWNVESSWLGQLEGMPGNPPTDQVPLTAHYRTFRAFSWAVADFFNLVGAVLYFYLYFILDTESIATEQDPSRNAFFRSVMRTVLLLAVGLLVGSVADRTVDLGDFQGLPTLLYSLFTSITMAMFFGRLNSHFFNTSRAARVFFVPLFYLYAALQAVYAMLGFRNVHISVSLIIMVFVLKIMLFFYVNKLINKGKFDGYIHNMIRQFGEREAG